MPYAFQHLQLHMSWHSRGICWKAASILCLNSSWLSFDSSRYPQRVWTCVLVSGLLLSVHHDVSGQQHVDVMVPVWQSLAGAFNVLILQVGKSSLWSVATHVIGRMHIAR